nr:aspyridones efflux protein apdf [Quercus suber]
MSDVPCTPLPRSLSTKLKYRELHSSITVQKSAFSPLPEPHRTKCRPKLISDQRIHAFFIHDMLPRPSAVLNTHDELEQKQGDFDKAEEEIYSSIDSLPATTPGTLPPPVQDGGGRAWLQVLGSFLVFAQIWGFTFAFGSFQSFYELEYLPTFTASNIAWIGTVSAFLLVVGGILSGPLFDQGYFRSMLLIGALLETVGTFLLSVSTQYYQIMLTQGILIGLGAGLLYLPGLALVGRSFTTHRSIAMALTTCGAPVGGIVYTLVFQQLIPRLGFGWTVRVMGFIMLGSYAIASPLLLWGAGNLGDLGSGKKRKLFDAKALRDLPFWSYSISNFLVFVGYIVPFIYLPSVGQTQLGLTQSSSLNLIMVAQATSVAGRLISGYVASRFGVMLPWVTCALTSGVLCLGWIGARTEGSLMAIAALYGAFSGALIPLPPSVFPVVCPDIEVLGARLGMAQGLGSIASLIGSPIAGALIMDHGTNYLGLQLFSGLVMGLGGCSLIGLWILLVRLRETKTKMI